MPLAAPSEVWIARALRCPACAAPLVLDEGRGALDCGHCGHREDLLRGEDVAWHELAGSEGAPAPARASAEEGPPTVGCAHCGAVIVRRPGALATQCHYCLSNLAVTSEDARTEAFDGIVPFGLTGREAQQKFASWLGDAWFAPGDLSRAAKVEELDSIYVPCHFWRTEARTEWRARVGILTTAAEDEAAGRTRPDGDPGHVRTRWEDQHGVIDEPVMELESASGAIATKELHDLGGFEPSLLVGYHQGYLGTHDAELPALTRAESHGRMVSRVEQARAARAESGIDAERHKDFQASTVLRHTAWRLALVPVFVVAYRYKGDVFRVLVHGTSGNVTGDHPISAWKVGFLVAVLVACGLVLVAILG